MLRIGKGDVADFLGTGVAQFGTHAARHKAVRLAVNNDYRDILEEKGLTLSGFSPDHNLVETAELTDRPFHVGVQFHPEFKSRPNRPHPLFTGFIAAALDRRS